MEEIIIKIERATQEEIKNAIDNIEKKLENQFKIKFKSITFDNGIKFLDWKSLELSIDWMNNYPRKKLSYKTDNQRTEECLQINKKWKLNFVSL